METSCDDRLLTTTEAAELVGRTQAVIRTAICQGKLPAAGRTPLGHHLLRQSDVLDWVRRHPTYRPHPGNRWNNTAAALGELGPATVEELGAFLSLHPGNVRKHLLILAAQGRAERRPDGQWVLTDQSDTSGAALGAG